MPKWKLAGSVPRVTLGLKKDNAAKSGMKAGFFAPASNRQPSRMPVSVRMASLVAFGCPLRTYGLVPADGSQSSLRPRVHPRRESRMKPPGADARRTGARPSRLGGEPNSTRVTDSGDLAKQARRPHAKANSAQRPRPGVDKYLARGARLTAEGPSRRVVGRGKSPEPRQEETGG